MNDHFDWRRGVITNLGFLASFVVAAVLGWSPLPASVFAAVPVAVNSATATDLPSVAGAPEIPWIAAGGSLSLTLEAAGSQWIGGENTNGQLGDGTTSDVTATVTEIAVTIRNPTANSILSGDFKAAATVSSTYAIKSVTAQLDNLSIPLAYTDSAWCDKWGCHPGWAATIPLTQTTPGNKSMLVKAVDVLGAEGSAQVDFIYSPAPKITLSSPDNYDVASPDTTIVANCIDCVTISASVSGKEVASGSTAILKKVSLQEWNGQNVALTVTGKNSLNQTVVIGRSIYVENSSMLSMIEKVPGKIWCVDSNRILYLDDSSGLLKIRNRLTKNDTAVSSGGMVPKYGYLSPAGAIFVEQSGDVLTSRIYEWNSGVILDHGYPNSASSLDVAGNYAIWSNSRNLYMWDFIAGKNTLIATDAGNWMNSVASNGAVAYWATNGTSDYNIKFYINGVTTKLTNDTQLWNTYTLTDGYRVIYRKQDKCCSNQKYALYLYSNNQEIELSPPRLGEPSPGTDYIIVNGWVAYTSEGQDGNLQVWTRSPMGIYHQATFYGTSSRIAALAGNGELFFTNSNNVYFDNGQLGGFRVGSSLVKPIAIDNQWYSSIGNTLYKLSTNDNTYTITSIANPNTGGTVSCDPNPVNSGETSTCTATTSTGYGFAGWGGDCAGQIGKTCMLSNITSAKTVIARFRDLNLLLPMRGGWRLILGH
jgi:hypothetical protein